MCIRDRDGDDVQLDNVARTVICNNVADCHIALHWDGDGLSYDKGCFYISVPDALKSMEPVASHWQQHDALGAVLIAGLQNQGAAIYKNGQMSIDLTQTSYSTIPSVDMELGNACSDHSDEALSRLADGLIAVSYTHLDVYKRQARDLDDCRDSEIKFAKRILSRCAKTHKREEKSDVGICESSE